MFRYAQLLSQLGRIDDALLIANACLKLDPYNSQVADLLSSLQGYRKQQGAIDQARGNLQRMEEEVRKNPTNFQRAFELAGIYLQMQQTDAAVSVLERVLNDPHVDAGIVASIVSVYAQMQNWPKVEPALEKLVKITPDNAEAWYNLASLKVSAGKPAEAIQSLRRALELSAQRLRADPKAHNLLIEARKEPGFHPLRQMPEFQKLVPPQ